MKNLKLSALVTAVLGFFAVFAIIFLFLSLSDIADTGTTLQMEWYVAGICLIIISLFTISSLVTLWLLLKLLNTSEIINLMTDYNVKSKSSRKKNSLVV
ncbi:MAG: hypothetical protein ACM3NR_00790 [Methanosarcina sp.]